MRFVSKAVLLFALAGIAAAAWVVAILKPYTPGSDFGYGLGLAGGLMMLMLLSYPLRKHVKVLRRLGTMKPWFQAHMVLGALGPVLVIFHTTFTVNSFNALVALLCMVIVASSGFIGRYAYRQIHHGLYGRKASVDEFEEHMRTSERGLASLVRAMPEAAAALARFREEAFSRGGGALERSWRFLMLRLRARGVAASLDREIAQLIRREGPARGWDGAAQAKRIRRGGALVRSYLRAVNAAAQFGVFERIFSLWHVMHIPLVYLLVLSAAYHVLAVHMY
ncbi:MAG TPA: hypothetical protein PK042_03045 [Usitatibacteraceae bacterium]|nr:hypothetical protein [Usitatibacteraceae bacterium]